jgi:putative transport protein
MISMVTGIMSGALTSTPAFSAAQATAATLVSGDAAQTLQDAITIGHAIAYIFGVIGVVLFVQLIPRILKADMNAERKKIAAKKEATETASKEKGTEFKIDPLGFAAFGLVAVAGIFIGMIRVPLSSKGFSGTTFSLTTTGGVLISSILFSYWGHIGPISFDLDSSVLKILQELGLIFFLIGAGIPGGTSFVKYFHPIYFVFGVIITVVPMIIGYIAGELILKLPLLDSLGAITGGMTSTPALGSLIRTAETNDVVSSYASTYPIALICVVLGSQIIILLFGA